MTRIPEARPTPVAACLQPVAIAASWLTLVAFATAVFFAPEGPRPSPPGMTWSASAARWRSPEPRRRSRRSGSAAGSGGPSSSPSPSCSSVRSRRCSSPISSGSTRPSRACGWTSRRSSRFGIARRGGRSSLPDTTGRWGPRWVWLGTAAGLLIRFRRQRPRLATGMALAILFAFASEPGRQFAFDLVTWTGWRLRYHLVPWSISDDQISITGMILGAIAGAVVASLAAYAAGRGPAKSPRCLTRIAQDSQFHRRH